jgi:hypothetical protein
MPNRVPGLVCPVCLVPVDLAHSDSATMATVTCPVGHQFTLRGRPATDTVEFYVEADEAVEYVRVRERQPVAEDSWVLASRAVRHGETWRTYDVPRLLWEAYATARAGLSEAEAALEAYTEVADRELDEWSR